MGGIVVTAKIAPFVPRLKRQQEALRLAPAGVRSAPCRYKGLYGGTGSGKLLVWDKVLRLGTTYFLAGFASVTSNLVVSFYFAKRGLRTSRGSSSDDRRDHQALTAAGIIKP
jgi:hypothetical protein